MAAIDEVAIRELAAMRAEGAPITSCYLDVDGRRLVRHQDLQREVELLVRQARERTQNHQSVEIDLRNIERYVRHGIDRTNTRGVAIFSCADQDFWQVIELPVPVTPQLTINQAPMVGQLEAVAQRNEPIGILAVDRQRARLFVCALGRLLEHSEIFDELPREEDTRGERDRGGNHPEHIEAAVQQHVRRATRSAFQLWRKSNFAHFAIAAPPSLVRDVEDALHPYLKDRLAGRLDVPPTASHEELLAASFELETKLEARRQARIVNDLRQAVAKKRRGVAGLAPVLRALSEHRIDRLLVSQGYTAPGWRCDGCAMYACVGRTCKACGDEMVELENVVEDVVQDALAQSCQVEICVGNADLDVMGQIGALLRY